VFVLSPCGSVRARPSFPTRRSSDLGAVALGDFVESVDTPPGGGEAPTSGEGQFGYRGGSHLRSPFGVAGGPGARPGPLFVSGWAGSDARPARFGAARCRRAVDGAGAGP